MCGLRGLTDLVGELSTRSPEFRTWWAAHNVKLHRTSTKRMHHRVVGDLELTGEALELPGDAGLTIITYTVEQDSPSAHALDFLASWSRTPHPDQVQGLGHQLDPGVERSRERNPRPGTVEEA